MFHYASKFLPLFVYPLGLASLLLTCSHIIKRDSMWSKRLSLIALILLVVGGNRFVSTFLTRSLERQYAPLETTPKADAIVVLGGGTLHQSPPRVEHEVNAAGDRLLYAARLYHAGAAPVILVSGGQSKWSGPDIGTGAKAMSDILQLAGVPETSIILEEISSNTYENAVETAKILGELKVNNMILVTSAFHMPRSMGIFKKFDMILTPAPTDFYVTDQDIPYLFTPDPRIQLINLVPTSGNMNSITRALKEYMGIFVYRLRGWI